MVTKSNLELIGSVIFCVPSVIVAVPLVRVSSFQIEVTGCRVIAPVTVLEPFTQRRSLACAMSASVTPGRVIVLNFSQERMKRPPLLNTRRSPLVP